MPELEVGLAVGAWSMDTDTGDERGSGRRGTAAAPSNSGSAASPSGASTAVGLKLPGTTWGGPPAASSTWLVSDAKRAEHHAHFLYGMSTSGGATSSILLVRVLPFQKARARASAQAVASLADDAECSQQRRHSAIKETRHAVVSEMSNLCWWRRSRPAAAPPAAVPCCSAPEACRRPPSGPHRQHGRPARIGVPLIQRI